MACNLMNFLKANYFEFLHFSLPPQEGICSYFYLYQLNDKWVLRIINGIAASTENANFEVHVALSSCLQLVLNAFRSLLEEVFFSTGSIFSLLHYTECLFYLMYITKRKRPSQHNKFTKLMRQKNANNPA